MNIYDNIDIILVSALIFIALIGQQFYLIKASINKVYSGIMLSISIFILIVNLFYYSDTYKLIDGIIYSLLFFALVFSRKGITKQGLLGIKGDSCKWNKVNKVKLVKYKNRVKLIYLHHGGDSFMYFNYTDCNKLIKVLRQFLDDNKINIDINNN